MPSGALPNRENTPTISFQLSHIGRVSNSIAPDLRLPILPIGFGNAVPARAIVPMPKASVNEYDFSSSGKDEIWFAGEADSVQSVSVSHTEDQTTNGHFRAGVTTLHGPHDSTTFVSAFRHCFSSIFRLGSVSNSSTISLYRSMTSLTATRRPLAANLPSS